MTGHSADGPPTKTPLRTTEGEQRLLVTLCDSWTAYMSELSKGHGPRIANLSKDLPPANSLIVYQWVAEFIYVCELLEWNLNDKGVMWTAEPRLERIQHGEPVPADIRRVVSDLQEAWTRLFAEIEPAAYDWVDSQLRRPEVIAHSEREKELAQDRLAEQHNVFHLDWQRQRRKDRQRSIWDTRVGGVG